MLFDKFYKLAKNAGLSFPVGRAWYLVGRHYNTGRYHDDLKVMSSMKEETARCWQRHYMEGGSAKCLKRTIIQEKKLRAKKRKEQREARIRIKEFYGL